MICQFCEDLLLSVAQLARSHAQAVTTPMLDWRDRKFVIDYTCMPRATILLIIGILGLSPISLSLGAHHSFAAQYDRSKAITLTGTVTKVEWMNPHIYFYIDVKDADRTVNWAIEGGAPSMLYRNGWRQDSLKAGDQVTVDGWLAKDGSNLANMRTVTLANGKTVFGASSGGDTR